MAASNLLSYVRATVTVDVDSMDPAVAARHTSDTAKFTDMTSNQAIVCGEASNPDRASLLAEACALAAKKDTGDIDLQVDNALDILTVLLAKQVFPYLTGRVHAQTAPAVAYDAEGTVAHAKKLLALFEAHGIDKSRVCFKIPATPESIIACEQLEKEGIRTLATCLFSLPQAVAASQAGCLYVAPYFNELRVHFEPGVWKEYANTAQEHPMSPVISSIVKTYKAIGSKTLVMPASIVTSTEAVALASLRPDHLTLAGGVLDQLAAAQSPAEGADNPKPMYPQVDLQTPPAVVNGASENGPTVEKTDFLANRADALRQALAADAEATRKLADALKIFGEMELKTKDLIRKQLSGL
ncbi:aldolase [Fomitopsis serialis]|uniref:aldolase n=1 Tax=Fomitopsis serialis TaxID=139415 RepID=UPI002008803F|nr:aldolase [Neoantrodia serialis]KAH9937687.1 aldolase [Neoantrodia serialis]